jgi:hypothetical protein
METTLLLTYIICVVGTLVNIILPMFIVRSKIKAEMEKSGDEKPYTWLQTQAKCFEVAPYEYYSWGGSFDEDFVEYAVQFAILVCFGMMLPVIAFIGLLATMIIHRLLAFRMVNVTCRPFPDPSDGIGVWQDIFSLITMLAVVINTGLVVVAMEPVRNWSLLHKGITFLALQHLLVAIRISVGWMIHDEPEDVMHIRDINHEFKISQLRKRHTHASDEKKADFSKVDLSTKD